MALDCPASETRVSHQEPESSRWDKLEMEWKMSRCLQKPSGFQKLGGKNLQSEISAETTITASTQHFRFQQLLQNQSLTLIENI